MIPKIIHYCWFGDNSKTKLMKKCLQSWKKKLVGYKIYEWNEKRFDVNQCAYSRYCYENKLWAHLSDYARVKILYEYGGIYLDTDVEVLQSFDPLLNHKGFFGTEDGYVNTGLGFGTVKKLDLVKRLVDQYEVQTESDLMKLGVVNCPKLNTVVFEDFGFNVKQLTPDGIELKDGVLLMGNEYMNPFDDKTGVLNVTDNTISIHWYSKTWMPVQKKIRNKITRRLHRVLGVDFFS